HAELAVRVQLLLRQEEAVLAVEVADRSRGLGEDVERTRQGRCAHSSISAIWFAARDSYPSTALRRVGNTAPAPRCSRAPLRSSIRCTLACTSASISRAPFAARSSARAASVSAPVLSRCTIGAPSTT